MDNISFKGFVYQGWEDYEEDNVKIFHDVLTPAGKTISMPFSPYTRMNQQMFEKWVLIGCPTESKKTLVGTTTIHSNWTAKDLQEAFNRQF